MNYNRNEDYKSSLHEILQIMDAMNQPIRIAVTGAAGQIAYSLIFHLAAGELLGPNQPIILHLLEISPALNQLYGVGMELDDGAFPLLEEVILTDDPNIAFSGVDYAFLIGAKPRGAGMERSDLLKDNAGIFGLQGQALNESASRDVKVLVVGNPANSNAWIAYNSAPDLSPTQFSSMMRLDHNRAIHQLAAKTNVSVSDVKRMIVWGNHSATQYPDIHHALINGQAAQELIDEAWLEEHFIPVVQQRGTAIIQARGSSSIGSAAYAALSHMRTWIRGTDADDWVSMGVVSDGSYGVPEGLIYAFPVTIKNGIVSIVQDLPRTEQDRSYMQASIDELQKEQAALADLGFS